MPYTLETTTWENDADHYQTCRIDGLLMEDVMFYLYIFNQFKSAFSSIGLSTGLGNEEIGDETLIEIIKEALNKFPGISESIQNRYYIAAKYSEDDDPQQVADQLYDELTEIFGNTIDYCDYTRFMRVAESFKVLFYERNGRDVTEMFK